MNVSSKTLLILSIFIAFTYTYTLPVYAKNAQKLDVTVNEVVGDVEVMLPNTFEWVPAPSEGGSIFTEGVQVRTGPFSSISLVLADSSVVLVDSFTFMTVEKFFKLDNVVTTRLNLIVGSIVNTLSEGAQYEDDYKVATPSTTTSLNRSEIKKIVAGAMYEDSVREGFKNVGDQESEASQRTGLGVQRSPGGIAQQRQIKKESSIAAPSK